MDEGKSSTPPPVSSTPLRISTRNPRYFVDADGNIVFLTGSHTWANFVDNGKADPPAPFDYTAYLDFLDANHHNFFRLWSWEQAKWMTFYTGDYYFRQSPFLRTGPGNALDGKPKFDLSRFDQTYFDRARERVIQAGRRGIYVSIQLFNGFSVESKGKVKNPWPGHPMNLANNINGINGDPNGDNAGPEVHTLQISNVTLIQQAYVRKMIDTVNDLDNVLYEICNECTGGSEQWQYRMITYIKTYELTKPKQHPVGMSYEWPGGSDTVLLQSDADWIAPHDEFVSDGGKVVISDTDHMCGTCGDRSYVWRAFTLGRYFLLMDGYGSSDYVSLAHPEWYSTDPTWVSMRANMGYAREYAERMDMLTAIPRGDLTSTGYALASADTADPEYLVYQPSSGTFTVNLSGTQSSLEVEWLNPSTGQIIAGPSVAGGGVRAFSAPFGGDAVLYLKSSTLPRIEPRWPNLHLVGLLGRPTL